MTPPKDGISLRDSALEQLAARHESVVRQGQRALIQAALFSGRASLDDVREVVPLPPGVNPKLFGSVPTPLVRDGILERVGFISTCRPIAHARPLSLWRISNKAAARKWLADNPELPAPAPRPLIELQCRLPYFDA